MAFGMYRFPLATRCDGIWDCRFTLSSVQDEIWNPGNELSRDLGSAVYTLTIHGNGIWDCCFTLAARYDGLCC